jgi:hypothetical protein
MFSFVAQKKTPAPGRERGFLISVFVKPLSRVRRPKRGGKKQQTYQQIGGDAQSQRHNLAGKAHIALHVQFPIHGLEWPGSNDDYAAMGNRHKPS